MPDFRFVHPSDQPERVFRLIDWLESNFNSQEYDDFYCLVAFAKIKPFYKLHDSIQKWKRSGKTSNAVFGVDLKGTSYQALQYALANFNVVNILNAENATFHPKLYVFSGENKASAYYGSGNFTVGGLEQNFEGGVIIDYCLPTEQAEFDILLENYYSVFKTATPCIKQLTPKLLEDMKGAGLLLDETSNGSSGNSASSRKRPAVSASLFGKYSAKPPRPISKSIMEEAAKSAGILLPAKALRRGNRNQGGSPSTPSTGSGSLPDVLSTITDGLVIQVNPHHNGEIFLSKIAVNQNSSFFGFPFTGKTVPKKGGNPSYPQRIPDPVVNIRVYDSTGRLVNSELNYPLNTVFYESKSEIRITINKTILAPLDIASVTTDYPILVMRLSSTVGCDYDLDFLKYGSSTYFDFLNICNQELPAGGKPVGRKMGWI